MLSVHSDDYYMGEALKQAQRAFEEKEVPVGAVVVSKNKIIAKAYNQVERLNDATAHAEMLAITSAANTVGFKYLTECTLYVTLEPCTMCAGATFWSQLGMIVWGASDPKRGFRKYNDGILHPKTKIKTGIRADACQEILEQFFNQIRGNNTF